MAVSAYGPRERLFVDFAGATMDIAQHPAAGAAKVGARIAYSVTTGQMSSLEVVTLVPTEEERRANIAVTAASHALARVTVPAKNLKNAVPFALEGLVLGGVAQAGAEFRVGENGLALPVIDKPNDDQRARYLDLLSDPAETERFGNALGGMIGEMANPMSKAQGAIDQYHKNTADTSAQFAGNPDVGARIAALTPIREQLSADLRPVLLDTLPADLRNTTGEVLVENVIRCTPSPALAGEYFGPPPQA